MLTRDDRPVRPYPITSYNVCHNPLSSLFWELRWHGFGPLGALDAVVLQALRGSGTFDFWRLRGRVAELACMPPPILV